MCVLTLLYLCVCACVCVCECVCFVCVVCVFCVCFFFVSVCVCVCFVCFVCVCLCVLKARSGAFKPTPSLLYYLCVLIPLHLCPHTAILSVCPHATISVSAHCYTSSRIRCARRFGRRRSRCSWFRLLQQCFRQFLIRCMHLRIARGSPMRQHTSAYVSIRQHTSAYVEQLF